MANGNMQGMGMMAQPNRMAVQEKTMPNRVEGPVVNVEAFKQKLETLSVKSRNTLEQHLTPTVKTAMAEIFGKEDGYCKGKGGSMHLADFSIGILGESGIVASSVPVATGAALTSKLQNKDFVSLVFFGDGASNQGAVFEAMNLASVLKLPVLFVFENNGYAEFTGVDYHCGGGDIAGRAEGFGMPSYKLDGSDFFAVQEAAAEAVQRARKGDGPSAIECYAKRWYGHFEGDPQHYRTKKELESIRKKNDPLIIFRQKVEEAGLIESCELDLIDDDLLSQVTNAVEKAKNSPLPNVEELTTNVYEKGSY